MTLWVLAIFVVIHASLSLFVVLFQHRAVRGQLSADLLATAALAAETVASDGSWDGVPPGAAERWAPLWRLTLDEAGAIRYSADAPSASGLEARVAEIEEASRGEDGVTAQQAGDFLVATAPIESGGLVAVAVPGERIDEALAPFVIVMLATLPIGLLAAGVPTWYMSGLTVRPLQQVRSFAKELSAETISEGIDLDDAAPEVELLREELERAMARIRDGYDRQARFLANVSHELKTPISVIRTEAQVLLAGTPEQEDLKAFARSASEEMHRLGRMVESFLLLTRIRHGTAEIKAERHDANEVLMEAVGYCGAMARQYDVSLLPILHEGSGCADIEGNADLIQTALGNLVRNAIRFSPSGCPVEVGCACANGTISFGVRDFGPGVPETLIERLFEPFTQANEERLKGRGSGLGLQIAQAIAELHGGFIGVENLEEGCRFTLTLPRPKGTVTALASMNGDS